MSTSIIIQGVYWRLQGYDIKAKILWWDPSDVARNLLCPDFDKIACDAPFSISSCNTKRKQVKEFNDRLLIRNSNVPIARIVGEQKYFTVIGRK